MQFNSTLPSIDQNLCSTWTQQDNDFYNKLPFYFMAAEANYRKHWTVWKKLFGKVNWKPGQGNTMRTVIAEPTPIMRQLAFPRQLSETALADLINVRERKLDSVLHWQKFFSPHFYFLPSFQDFMKHIDDTMRNIQEQITVFEDVYYRTQVWHRAPYVYVCGVGIVAAPTGTGNALGTAAKTNAWIEAQIVSLMGTQVGYLSLSELFKALNAIEQTVGATPFDGTGTPQGDSNPLKERFCLVQSAESWNNFIDDPWTKENRPLNMNIVTDSFKGDLFGRIRSKLERYPLRFAIPETGGVLIPTMYNPEVVEENPDREDYGQTKPNPLYALPANSPVEVAFLVGGPSFDAIDAGPPPPEFTRSMDMGEAAKMNWNGRVWMNKNFLVPCVDSQGNTTVDTNSFGEYLRLQGTLAVGARAVNPRNIMPIIFKRRVGITTTV